MKYASKPHETVFVEEFTFADIYVSLEAQPLNQNGDKDKKQQPVDLETWVKELICKPNKLRCAKNLTPQQVKSAKSWKKAKYDENFRIKLGLPPNT